MKRFTHLPVSLSLLALIVCVPAATAAKPASPALPERQVTALVELERPRGLNRFVRAVSNPDSKRYREYASVQQLVERFGAKPKTRKRVMSWFSARGVEATVDPTGAFVIADLPRARAARLLGGGASASATGIAPSVPAQLRGAVAGIELLSAAPVVQNHAAKPPLLEKPYRSILRNTGSSSGCPAARTGGIQEPGFNPFTPNQYLKAYGHSSLHNRGLKGEGQTVAVVETGGFRRSDIATFARCFGLRVPPIEVIGVGVKAPLPPEDETTLDLEMLTAGAPGLDRIYVYEGGGGYGDVVLTAGAALGKPGKRPDVISISLGFCEPLLAGGGMQLRSAIDNVFAVAAGAGISVLVSAGDEGSSGCRVETETERTALPVLAVSLPSSSPYVTAVGGTNLELSKRNRIKHELVWNDSIVTPAGGGGGSSILSVHTPWWQTAGQNYGPGRKVPDISALADIFPGYAVYCTANPGCYSAEEVSPGWISIGGTSAAAPLMAAGVALANQYAERRGQPRLGFLNPLLYDLGERAKTRRAAFNDVVLGNNDIGRALPPEAGGGTPLGCCSAKPGYDWASGWGSLKVPGFAKAAARVGA